MNTTLDIDKEVEVGDLLIEIGVGLAASRVALARLRQRVSTAVIVNPHDRLDEVAYRVPVHLGRAHHRRRC